jgi:hypothetical protein
MIFWGVLGNFCQVVSSIIFRQTADNIAPGWSDFGQSLLDFRQSFADTRPKASIVGYVWPMGFSAGTLILLRRLFKIACELLQRVAPDTCKHADTLPCSDQTGHADCCRNASRILLRAFPRLRLAASNDPSSLLRSRTSSG